jgi:hydrogenase/urease accessory protein HupE
VRAVLVLLAALALAGLARSARAHPLAPSLLDVRLGADGRADVLFKTPALQPAGSRIEPLLPDHCRPQGDPEVTEEGSAALVRLRVDCGERGLVGARLGFSGLSDSRTNALVRVELPGGFVQRGVVHGGEPTLEVTGAPSAWQTARDYVWLGFGHILGGIDHLLFVLGLLVLVRGARMLVETVTAFTLGHSVTLSLAALGFVRAPTGPIEVAIAASIVWLAVEIAQPSSDRPASPWRRPRTLAGGFGLLHGFGFAGALAEVGLPAADIPLALGGFNLGIELGQLCFVALLVAIHLALRRLGMLAPAWGSRALAYSIGSLASFWMFERAASLL